MHCFPWIAFCPLHYILLITFYIVCNEFLVLRSMQRVLCIYVLCSYFYCLQDFSQSILFSIVFLVPDDSLIFKQAFGFTGFMHLSKDLDLLIYHFAYLYAYLFGLFHYKHWNSCNNYYNFIQLISLSVSLSMHKDQLIICNFAFTLVILFYASQHIDLIIFT